MIERLEEFRGAVFFRIKAHLDERGQFLKFFNASEFQKLGWPTKWVEQYVTTSQPGVLRGLHFQLPPHDHAKLVLVLSGKAFDVALDLRKSSPTYGQSRGVLLEAGEGVFLPKGFAHGFCVPGPDPAVLLYSATTEYAPAHDSGILWSSINVDWPIREAITSARDKSFPKFNEFKSPF
jgi:dTDP-4-dehydrorhamnose 3,5-epimerase